MTDSLNKDDLFLLMESYRNMIQMHATIVEQQRKIIDLQNSILIKQEDISLKQSKSLDQVGRLFEKLDESSACLLKIDDNVKNSYGSLDKSFITNIDNIKEKIGENQLDTTKQHSGINNRLYVSMGLMVTIILGLIGIMSGLLDKYDLLKEIHQTISQIYTFLHIK